MRSGLNGFFRYSASQSTAASFCAGARCEYRMIILISFRPNPGGISSADSKWADSWLADWIDRPEPLSIRALVQSQPMATSQRLALREIGRRIMPKSRKQRSGRKSLLLPAFLAPFSFWYSASRSAAASLWAGAKCAYRDGRQLEVPERVVDARQYRVVILISLWPASSCTVRRSTPAITFAINTRKHSTRFAHSEREPVSFAGSSRMSSRALA